MPDPLAMLPATPPRLPPGPTAESGSASADAFSATLEAVASGPESDLTATPEEPFAEAAPVQDDTVPTAPCLLTQPQPPACAALPAACGAPGTEGPGASLPGAAVTPGQDAAAPPLTDAAAAPDDAPDRTAQASAALPDADIPVARHASDAAAPQAMAAIAQGPAAPASAHASPVAASFPPPHAQLAQAIESLAQGRRQDAPATLSIRLSPADLGQVEVRIEPVRGGTMRVEIVAERPETMALLQRDQQELLRALDRAGLSTGEPPGFSLAGRQGGAAERQPGERRMPRQTAPARPAAGEIATAIPVPARQMHRPAGRIDLIA